MSALRVVICATFLVPIPALAVIEAEHPSDYVRVLESEKPELWAGAVHGLLGEKEELPGLAVSSVVRRFHELPLDLKIRVARSLSNNLWHPQTLSTLQSIVLSSNEELREAAVETLLKLRLPGAMDVFRDLIREQSTYRLEALQSLVTAFNRWLEFLEAPQNYRHELDPVLDPANGTPEEIFDRRYLPAVRTLLHSPDPKVRSEALSISRSLDTPGLRDEWASLMEDPLLEVRSTAQWELAETGDPRPCPFLFRHADEVARTWTDERSRDARIRSVGSACAPAHYFDYFRWYREAGDETSRAMVREMIEGSTDLDLLEDPSTIERLRPLAEDSDEFLRETARRVLDWHEEAQFRAAAEDIRGGVRPVVLVGLAFISVVAGILLFVWAFRLYALSQRIRNRPVAKIRSMPMGQVALEGEVQPAGDYLRHPVTDEPCIYYVGADGDHPHARFYVVDDTDRVLVDPQRAVIFSDDGVLVAGERVHLVGFVRSLADGQPIVTKDPGLPPLYQRLTHFLLEALFGFGRKSGVTKMLFSNPSRCFWIWDDLERQPMGEKRDFLWLGAAVALGGAWMILFAVTVFALIDQEMSTALAESLAVLSDPNTSLLRFFDSFVR
jgi:hypothetical protein